MVPRCGWGFGMLVFQLGQRNWLTYTWDSSKQNIPIFFLRINPSFWRQEIPLSSTLCNLKMVTPWTFDRLNPVCEDGEALHVHGTTTKAVCYQYQHRPVNTNILSARKIRADIQSDPVRPYTPLSVVTTHKYWMHSQRCHFSILLKHIHEWWWLLVSYHRT